LQEDKLRGEAGLEVQKEGNREKLESVKTGGRLTVEKARAANQRSIEGMKLNATDALKKAQIDNLRANADYHRQYLAWLEAGGKNKAIAPKIADFLKSAEAGGFIESKVKGHKILKGIDPNDMNKVNQFQQMANDSGIEIKWTREHNMVGPDKLRPLPVVPKAGKAVDPNTKATLPPKSPSMADKVKGMFSGGIVSKKEQSVRQDLTAHGMDDQQVEDYIKRAKASGKLQ
jgi:hypothetical protein